MSKLAAALSFILLFSGLRFAVAAGVKQPENAWSNEIVPAATDPEIQRLLDIMNMPPPWDHNW
jgi:hypothetical protein